MEGVNTQSVISALGAGQGLNLGGVQQDLVDAQRRPAENRLNQREASIRTDLSALGNVRSQAEKLSQAGDSLAEADIGRQATSSASDQVAASVEADAPTGRFQVEVSQLAGAQSLASGGFASSDTTVGTGSLSLTVGSDDPVSINIGSDNNTLAGIREAINDSGAAVDATVADDGSQQRLLLTSQRTGNANTIDLAVNDDDGDNTDGSGLSQLSFTGGARNLTETAAAQDANLTVNGLSVTRSDNQVSDVVAGVTLDLQSTTGANPVEVEVSEDQSGLTQSVEGLVEKFNKLNDQIGSATRFNPDSGESGPLVGDSTLRSLESGLNQTLVSGFGESGVTPVELGLRTGEDGSLQFDSEALDDALANDREGTVAALNAAGSAIADQVGRFTGSDGRFDTREEGLQSSLEDVSEDRERLDDRISRLDERLTSEFSSLQTLVSDFKQTGEFLTQQLSQ